MVHAMQHRRVALLADPLDYPGTPASAPVLLLQQCEHPLDGPVCRGAAEATPCVPCAESAPAGETSLDDELRRRGVAGMAQRVAVAAVGCNGSTEVLRAKLAAVAALGPVVPIAPAMMTNLAVGHSAHVSAPGYLAAAPFHAPGARTPVVIAWLDEAQAARLDATEPNYVRRSLSRSDYPVRLTDSGETLDGVAVYESVHGILTDGRVPLPLRSQTQVATWLREYAVAPWVTMDAEAAARSLACDSLARTAVRDELVLRGLVAASRLETAA